MAIWAVVSAILKAAGKKALEAAASNALSNMGGLGTVLGTLAGSGEGSSPLEDRTVANIGGRDVKLSDTKQPSKGMDWGVVGSALKNLAASGSQRPMSQPSAPLEDDSGTLKMDEAGKKVLLSKMGEYGKKLTDRETLEAYRRTGGALGKFASDYEADEFARRMKQQRNYYGF